MTAKDIQYFLPELNGNQIKMIQRWIAESNNN